VLRLLAPGSGGGDLRLALAHSRAHLGQDLRDAIFRKLRQLYGPFPVKSRNVPRYR
jgi:hypothetical protein